METQAYYEGFVAFKNGLSKSANPYSGGSSDFYDWGKGFARAKALEEMNESLYE